MTNVYDVCVTVSDRGHDDRSESRTWSLTNNPYLREFSVGRGVLALARDSVSNLLKVSLRGGSDATNPKEHNDGGADGRKGGRNGGQSAGRELV